jgi:tetratricopeptide (TPR) repeat protein
MRDRGEDQLAAGREALQRHAWREAFEQLRAADLAEPLPPEDLELLAEAAWCVGRLDDSIAVWERTHAAYLGRGDRRRAGFLALLLGHGHFAKGKASQANGWMRRAEQSLAAEQNSIEYGHLLRARSLMTKDPDEALAHARASHELATRLGDRDPAALTGTTSSPDPCSPTRMRSRRRPASSPATATSPGLAPGTRPP